MSCVLLEPINTHHYSKYSLLTSGFLTNIVYNKVTAPLVWSGRSWLKILAAEGVRGAGLEQMGFRPLRQ